MRDDPEAIFASFAARRARQIVVAIVLGVAILALYPQRNGTVAGVPLGLVLFGIVIVAIAYSLYNWRCPACGTYLGRRINPRFCSSCGEQLRRGPVDAPRPLSAPSPQNITYREAPRTAPRRPTTPTPLDPAPPGVKRPPL